MPVPSSISDLSTTPSLNSPAGTESPSTVDDYLRTQAAFIRQVDDKATGTVKAADLAATGGSALVGFQQAGAGAVARTGQDKLREVVSVKDFGAVGDFNPATGVGTDDTAAFVAAADTGRRVLVPSGKYKITSTISTVKATSFIGETSESSRLYFHNCDGFNYDLTTQDANVEVEFERIALCTTVKGTRTAVKFTRATSTNKSITTKFSDVAFVGGDIYGDVPGHVWPGESSGYALEWLVAVDGDQVDAFHADAVYIRGRSNAHTTGFPIATRGFVLKNTTYVYTRALGLYFLESAFRVSGQSEGIRFVDSDVVACNRGFVSEDTASPANHCTIYGNHFSCVSSGVYIGPSTSGATPKTGQHFIYSNFFLKRVDSGTGFAGYIAIYTDSTFTKVFQNVIQTNESGDFITSGDVGVYVGGAQCSVSNNTGLNCGILVKISSTAQDTFVSDNFVIAFGAGTSRAYLDQGTSTSMAGLVSAEDRTRGTYPIQSNMKLGEYGFGAKTRTIDALTSGNDIDYDSRLEFLNGSSTLGQGECRVRAGTFYSVAANNIVGGNLRPNADNTIALGQAGARWSVVYAGTGTINTSDARAKQDIAELDESEHRVAVRLKSLIRKYRFRDAVTEKGDAARIHIGVIAQDVIAAFEAEGIDAMQYGVLCYDEWGAEPELLDSDGNVITPAVEAGNRYGIRYEELLAFIIAAI